MVRSFSKFFVLFIVISGIFWLFPACAEEQALLQSDAPPLKRLSPANAADQILLPEEMFEEYVNQQADLTSAKFYSVRGIIVDSGTTGKAEGYGKATVIIVGKTVMITFSAKITTAGTETSTYNIGIGVSTLRSLNPDIPAFTVGNGGNIEFLDSSGNYDVDMNGYGGEGANNATDNRWNFGRLYNTSGDFGLWSDNDFTLGKIIKGTVYGTLN